MNKSKLLYGDRFRKIVKESSRVFLIPPKVLFGVIVIYTISIFVNSFISFWIMWMIIITIVFNLVSIIYRMKATSEQLEDLIHEIFGDIQNK